MVSEEFGDVFSRMFGNLYSNLPSLDKTTHIAGVYGRYEGVSFRRMRYGGNFTLALPHFADEITFVIPLAGRIIFNQGSGIAGGLQVGIAVDKVDLNSVSFIDDHEQYGFSIRHDLFAARLSILLGKPIMSRVKFAPQVDLNNAALKSISALLGFFTGAESDQLINSSALMPARLQEMLVDAVLESWPHNYTQALQHRTPLIAPRHVKLAIDYIQAHPDILVSGAELAQLTNVSLRALQEGFRRFVGSSIVTYQRQVRLEWARNALRQDPSYSISEVALRLGFTNVGRFSHYFKSAFGVSPLEVKKGSRR
ncbi:AraC family transcriptional regulator [Pseudomonas sp. EL_65y_Pfl2_R95]|uniref:AraC family transcriptional regulator n=1 Tax=Pseudomonas sp. EL_65y_Pfl2_R95 TaxID=3088698 RepID=UPI0030DD7809